MKLEFNVPEFRKGLNVTVRNASDKYLNAKHGETLELAKTDGPVVGTGFLVEAVPLHWREDQQQIGGLTAFNHEAGAREIAGLAQAMNRAYGLNEWGPEVVVLLFLVGDDVELEPEPAGDEEITFGDPSPEAPVSQPESPEPVEPPTSDEVPTEPQEAPVPRADEPEGSPISKFHKDDAGTDWAYRVTETGIVVLCARQGEPWEEAPVADSWPQAVVDFVEKLEG